MKALYTHFKNLNIQRYLLYKETTSIQSRESIKQNLILRAGRSVYGKLKMYELKAPNANHKDRKQTQTRDINPDMTT